MMRKSFAKSTRHFDPGQSPRTVVNVRAKPNPQNFSVSIQAVSPSRRKEVLNVPCWYALTCIYVVPCALLDRRKFCSYTGSFLHISTSRWLKNVSPCVQSDAIWEKVGKDQQEPDEKQGRNHETNKELLYLINQSRNPFKAPWFDRRQLCRDFVNWTGRMRPILSRIRIWTGYRLFCAFLRFI